jgi:hypothetical protein
MTWSYVYLFCFAAGFLFSLVGILGGGAHFHAPTGHHVSMAGHAHGPHVVRGSAAMSPFNPVTAAAFLAWFGGVGFLLTRYSSLWVVPALAIATASGVVGAGVLFLFLTRVLVSADENLDPADFVMTGVLGKVSSHIREDGTGEIIYSQGGTRRACGARSDTGQAIPRDTDVIVTRYEQGVAYVRRWTELAGD